MTAMGAMTAELHQQCQEHSGVCVRVENLEKAQSKMESAIDSIRRLMIGNLVSGVLFLLGVILDLVFRFGPVK